MSTVPYRRLGECIIDVAVDLKPKVEPTITHTGDTPTQPKMEHEIQLTFKYKVYAQLYAEFIRDSVGRCGLDDKLDVSDDWQNQTVCIRFLDSTPSFTLKDHSENLSESVLEFGTESQAKSWEDVTKLWKQGTGLGQEMRKTRMPKRWKADKFRTTLNISEAKMQNAMPYLYRAKRNKSSTRRGA